jgi:phosphoribosylformylglycinamidine synthase
MAALQVAVAEMALAGGIGMSMVVVPQIPNPAAILFGEDQGRYVVTTRDPDGVRAAANGAQLFAVPIGVTGGDALTFDLVDRGGPQTVTLADLRAAHEDFFPRLMGTEGALA